MKIGKYTLIATAAALLAVSAQAEQKLFVPASGDISDGANWFGLTSLASGVPGVSDAPTFNNDDAGQLNDQTVNIDVNANVQRIYNDWNAGGYVNTVGGPGTLTINGGFNWAEGIANRSGKDGGGTLNMTGNVEFNNPAGVSDIRTQNGTNNVIEFTPSSTLTLNSTIATLDFTGAGSIQFNGAVLGGANLMVQSGNASFNAGHDSSGHTGNVMLNSPAGKLTINGGIVGNSGNQLIGNWGGNLVEINGANSINGMGVSGWGDLTLDLNAGQDDIGSINEVQNLLVLDLTDLGAGEEVWFANSAGGAWSGTVSVLGFQEDTLRFGTDASGLTAAQLGVISGDTYGLTSTGYLTVIPEPGTLGLLFIGGMGLFVARRARV